MPRGTDDPIIVVRYHAEVTEWWANFQGGDRTTAEFETYEEAEAEGRAMITDDMRTGWTAFTVKKITKRDHRAEELRGY